MFPEFKGSFLDVEKERVLALFCPAFCFSLDFGFSFTEIYCHLFLPASYLNGFFFVKLNNVK